MCDEVMDLQLPWMPKELSPNARVHWSVKARAAKKYRADCRAAAMLAGLHRQPDIEGFRKQNLQTLGHKIRLEIDFYKPSNRGDDDNLEAMFKSGRDGISDAISIDDKCFVAVRNIYSPMQGGRVIVRLSAKNG